MTDLHVVEAKPTDAAALVGVIHAAFGARPPLNPPGTALRETVRTVEDAVRSYGGLLAQVDGRPAGAMLLAENDGWLDLRRVSVHPRFQHRGVATAMVGCAEEVAADHGLAGVRLVARAELPATLTFWRHRGYLVAGEDGPNIHLAKRLPVEVTAVSVEDTQEVGRRLATILRAGDLVLLTGELGAGKTTLTQGIGAGLGVRGQVTSPTFVISRAHPSTVGGPPLVHVDAYRLGGVAELDDLDLDTSVDDAVTVVEWGEGLAEGLAEDRLEVVVSRGVGEETADEREGRPADETAGEPARAPDGEPGRAPEDERADVRQVRVVPVGRRWLDVAVRDALADGLAADVRSVPH